MKDILIVDDHAGDRYLMREVLSAAGYLVREANDGAPALALCRQKLPDLVVTDIVMAAKDGIETIRELRQFAPDMPIVTVSGADYAPIYLNSVTLLGADAALSKPFAFAALVREVSALLQDTRVGTA